MKTVTQLTLIVLTSIALTACGGDLATVQDHPYPGSNSHSLVEVLDDRLICENTEWLEDEGTRDTTVITYSCSLKGGPEYYTNKTNFEVAEVHEIHQWIVEGGEAEYNAGAHLIRLTDGQEAIYDMDQNDVVAAFDRAWDNKYDDLVYYSLDTSIPMPQILQYRFKK